MDPRLMLYSPCSAKCVGMQPVWFFKETKRQIYAEDMVEVIKVKAVMKQTQYLYSCHQAENVFSVLRKIFGNRIKFCFRCIS